jgi:hypothetical protein
MDFTDVALTALLVVSPVLGTIDWQEQRRRWERLWATASDPKNRASHALLLARAPSEPVP